MELDPKALSDDGYIIDQRQTESISFGGCPSSKNGCGWIAAYNFLKALDRTPNPEVLLRRLERTLLPGGKLGLNFFALVHELRRQKVPLEFALRPFHAQELAQRNRAGIVLYRAGKTNHFATFARQPDGTLRFFGARLCPSQPLYGGVLLGLCQVPADSDHHCKITRGIPTTHLCGVTLKKG